MAPSIDNINDRAPTGVAGVLYKGLLQFLEGASYGSLEGLLGGMWSGIKYAFNFAQYKIIQWIKIQAVGGQGVWGGIVDPLIIQEGYGGPVCVAAAQSCCQIQG